MFFLERSAMERLRSAIIQHIGVNIPFSLQPVLHRMGHTEISVTQSAKEVLDPLCDAHHYNEGRNKNPQK